MKRTAIRAFLALALAGAVVGAAGADEITEIYQLIYDQAESLAQKHLAIVNLLDMDDPTTAPIMASALEDLLLEQKNYTEPSEREIYGRSLRLVCAAVGDFKYRPSAPFLWDVVQQVPDPLSKAEALISLGKLRAVEYAERISLYLRDLNFYPTQDADEGEKRAYGAIIALEKLKDIRGFAPVFFATEAWYSRRVRLQAERSLPNIVDDPTDAISEIVRLESPARKLKALNAEMASKATPARKIGIAVQALDLGHQSIARDKNEALAMAEVRKFALRSLILYKAQGTTPVSGCKESYERGFDDEERLLGLAALGANGGDAASTVLRDIILKLNADQRSGISDETRNRMARAAIENAAIAKNKVLRVALISVTSNDKWSGGIIQAAQAALKVTP